MSPPTGIYQVFTINYYDDYKFDLAGLTVPAEVLGQTVDGGTMTLATGSKVRVLETDHWITTIHAYDKKGRLIYTATKNPYLNTTDIVENRLDFVGKVLETKTPALRSVLCSAKVSDFAAHCTSRTGQNVMLLSEGLPKRCFIRLNHIFVTYLKPFH